MNHQKRFLEKHGWSITDTVGQDSSIRRYFRVSKADKTAILMETVPDHSSHATPGHSIKDFIKIDEWLKGAGLNAPDIYEVDQEGGYLLLEDFGNICFKEAVFLGPDPNAIYDLAASVLEALSAANCLLDLPAYYESHVHRRHRRVVDWYLPFVRGRKNEDALVEDYRSVWQGIENSLPACPQGFLHIDFHAENLMWLPERDGLQRCGILDFQGAMRGPAPYDLANLLEDARTDVPPELRARILSRFDLDVQNWTRILATQFHCRVIGQFIKQAALDGNSSYLKHIPRLQNYLREGIEHPVLKPLKTWFAEQGVNFKEELNFDALASLQDLIAPEAQ